MKIVNKIIFALIGVATLGSCTYLDKEPDTERTLEAVFGSRNSTLDWLSGVYSGISNPTQGWLRDGNEIYADDVYISPGYDPWWPLLKQIYGSWSSASANEGANLWLRMPRYIRRAYIFIENAHPLKDTPESEVETMKAECRFLACYYYYVLLSNYGAIPFKPNWIAPTEAEVSELQSGQVPFDEVVAWLDKELQDVAKLLPDKRTTAEYGRATSVMCHTVRSKMLLFAASPLVNGNPVYEGHVNNEGEELFNSTYDVEKWAKARDAIKTLLDLAHATGHQLYVERNGASIDPFMSLLNLWFTSNTAGNTEALFPYTRRTEDHFDYIRLGQSHADDVGGNGGLGVYQGLVDAFFMANGLPIDHPDSGYSETGFTTGVDRRNTTWIGGGPEPGDITMDHTFNMYAGREPRFYVTVAYHGSWNASVRRRLDLTNGSTGTDWSVVNGTRYVDNNHTHDAPNNGYLIRKKIDPSDNAVLNQYRARQNYNLTLYRLAASYLDYAEALNEAEDSGAARAEALTDFPMRVRTTSPSPIIRTNSARSSAWSAAWNFAPKARAGMTSAAG